MEETDTMVVSASKRVLIRECEIVFYKTNARAFELKQLKSL